MLLGVLLIPFDHGNVLCHVAWIACQVHLTVEVTMDARVYLNMLSTVY